MKFYLTLILIFICSFYVNGKDIKEVLLLHSYHTGFKWTDELTRGVLDGIGPQDKVRVFVEYMDYKRYQNKGFFYELFNLYKYKYGDLDIDGIICADNYAFQFFLENGNNIWNEDIPVTACGINNTHTYDFDTTRIKVIKEDIDVKNTLTSVFQLQPNTDTLIIISDQTLSGKMFLDQLLNDLKEYDKQIPYLIIDGTNYIDIENKIKKATSLPNNKAIILLSLYSNKYKVPIEMKHLSKELLQDINIPVFSFWKFLLDDHITGGSLICSYEQGYEAASILKLKMQDANIKIPSLNNPKHNLVFDFNKIKKHQLNIKNLPGSAKIINRDIPFHIKYRSQLTYFSSSFTVLILIILLLVRNIIKRRKIEIKLIESERRLDLALSGANEGLWDILLKDNTIICNDNLAKLLGYECSNDLNISFNNWQKLFKKQDIPQIREEFLLHLRGLSSKLKMEIEAIRKDGCLQYFSISGRITERDINNIPTRITGVVMDITSQKKFESQLKVAKEKAEESDRLKSSFLANMSHEIRTPMNAILGFSDILMYQKLNSNEKEKYIEQIKNNGENLLHIINDIVDVSKIESGQLKIKKEKFDLHLLLVNIEYACNSLIKARNKKVTFTIDNKIEGINQFIFTDPFRLEQILLNLISNAVKFTHQGGIKLKYYITDKNIFTFNVSDTGEGISPEDQLIIFERFRQAENSLKKVFSGTGLGLSITKSLVNMLGGEISVESEIDKGSVFTFTIPVESI